MAFGATVGRFSTPPARGGTRHEKAPTVGQGLRGGNSNLAEEEGLDVGGFVPIVELAAVRRSVAEGQPPVLVQECLEDFVRLRAEVVET